MSLLRVVDIGVSFGGVVAVAGVSFEVAQGEIFSIIGPNGAGKTTLFNLISGIYRPSKGEVFLDNAALGGLKPHELARRGLARTFQNLQIFFRMTALENVMVGAHLSERSSLLGDLLGLPGVARQNQKTKAWAQQCLERVGLQDYAQRPASGLPYGVLKRLEIARALASRPKILLLDEPAAGCNPVETEALVALVASIARDGVTIVLIEHDMKLVMTISDRVLVLAQGARLAEGPPRVVRENPQVIAAYLGDHGAREAARAGR